MWQENHNSSSIFQISEYDIPGWVIVTLIDLYLQGGQVIRRKPIFPFTLGIIKILFEH